VQSQQLLMKSQVFKDEVLTGTKSADQPAEEMSERRDHSRDHIGKVRIELCAKSFILQVYDLLAKHRGGLLPSLLFSASAMSWRFGLVKSFVGWTEEFIETEPTHFAFGLTTLHTS
jgi:hypothetical protein